MPAQEANGPDPKSGFDPSRHRKEIELMEQRFRERSDRHGGGPTSTGEIDSRVADEMRQFFDESTEQLKTAIPNLQDGDNAREIAETTGEIRRKIDDFFDQVREAGTPAAPSASASSPAAAGEPAAAEFSRRIVRGPVFPDMVVEMQPHPNQATVVDPTIAEVVVAAQGGIGDPPSAGERPVSDTGSDGKMDLKTALDKLRRSGASKTAVGNGTPQKIPRPASLRRPLESASAGGEPTQHVMPATPAAPAALPARREPTPLPAPSPVSRDANAAPPRRVPARTSAARPAPPASSQPSAPPTPTASSAPPASTPSPAPAAGRSGPRKFSGRQYAAHLGTSAGGTPRLRDIDSGADAAPTPPAQSSSALAPSAPPPSALATPKAAANGAAKPSKEPFRLVTPPAPPSPSAALGDAGEGFDSIFDEVQGIVMGTLKTSLDDSFDAARRAEPELVEAFSAKAAPTAGFVTPDPVSDSLSQSIAEAMRAPAPPPMPKSNGRFAPPTEDEVEPEDKAPNGPYDWGVKSAAKPKGAWLLDTPEQPASDTSSQTITNDQRRAKSETPAAAGGARGYLVRKAGQEIKRFQPVLQALRDSKILTEEELGVEPDGKGSGDEDFVSASSFKDDRPRGADIEEELSPMRLVEELRRLKRVTQALVAKGIISQDDLNKGPGE